MDRVVVWVSEAGNSEEVDEVENGGPLEDCADTARAKKSNGDAEGNGGPEES